MENFIFCAVFVFWELRVLLEHVTRVLIYD